MFGLFFWEGRERGGEERGRERGIYVTSTKKVVNTIN